MSNKCGNNGVFESTCPANAFEEMNITVPVVVRGFANVGDTILQCRGPFVVTRNSSVTPGTPGAVSRFTISQRLRIDIPVEFGAEADVGEGHIDFDPSPFDPPMDCSCNNR